ncbi:MAG: hypothetical protein ABJN65_16445 [Parasphingorhabdus sp.]
MDRLLQRGKLLAEQKKTIVRLEVKTALDEALPDHIVTEERRDGIAINGPNLSEKIADNSSLRDVAFLMRGVR